MRDLTENETNVLRLLVGGNSYKEIGNILHLSPNSYKEIGNILHLSHWTVASYLRAARLRCGMRNTVQLAVEWSKVQDVHETRKSDSWPVGERDEIQPDCR